VIGYSVTTLLRIIVEFAGKTIFKICEYLVKLQVRYVTLGGRVQLFFDESFVNKVRFSSFY